MIDNDSWIDALYPKNIVKCFVTWNDILDNTEGVHFSKKKTPVIFHSIKTSSRGL